MTAPPLQHDTLQLRARRWSSTRLAHGFTHAQGRLAAMLIAIAYIVGMLAWGEGAGSPLQNVLFDAYQRLLPRQVPQPAAIVVAIDDASLAALGQWPWPRTRLARLIDMVAQHGALAIGLDMIMPEPDRLSPSALLAERTDLSATVQAELRGLPSNDDLLARAMARAPVVLGRAGIAQATMPHITHQTPMLLQDHAPLPLLHSYPGQLVNLDILENAASGHGYLNDSRDRDGVLRALPLIVVVQEQFAPSFALELWRVAQRLQHYRLLPDGPGLRGIHLGNTFLPTTPDGHWRIYFSAPSVPRHVSALTLFNGEATGLVQGSIAIIGVTATGLGDIVTTPVLSRMYGVEIHAQVLENMLTGLGLQRPWCAPYLEALLCLLLAAALVALFRQLGPFGSILFFGGSTVALVGLSLLAFVRVQWLVDPALPSIGLGLVLGSLLTAGVVVAHRRRHTMRTLLTVQRLQNLHMSAELNAARKIQMGMLPAPGSIVGLPDYIGFHAILEPAEAVGGDLYDAFMVDAQHLFFVVGDVAGNGVPASLFMALSKTLCKSVVLREHGPLHVLMTAINGEISRDNPEALFVTAMVGILDIHSGEVVLCSAGHEAPLLLRPGEPSCSLETAGGPPFCVIDNFPYTSNRLFLQKGDMLVCITDGVTEAHNPDQRLYGLERVHAYCTALWQETTPPSAALVCQGLYDDVKRFVCGATPSDDITIMTIHFHPPSALTALEATTPQQATGYQTEKTLHCSEASFGESHPARD